MFIRCVCLALILGLSVAEESVKFPTDNNDEFQELDPHLRFGGNYLGYFLSFFGSPVAGRRGDNVRTPPGKGTTPPTGSATLFSAEPTTSATPSNTTEAMGSLSTATTAFKIMSNEPRAPSTFPTAYPTSLPTGIITSVGTFPSVVVSKPEATVSPLIHTGGHVCGCLPPPACVNQTTRSGISVRIVTNTPKGVTCPPGTVYCCSTTNRALCGLPNVIPGVTPGPGQANLGQYPWSVIILGDDNAYVGGGVLIGDRHVLTATHKVKKYGAGSNLKVRLGDWDLYSEVEPVRHLEVKISKITNHPNFSEISYANDISVITLKSAVPLLESPRPQINAACLPNAGDKFTGSKCWVAGWGKDSFNGAYQRIIKQVDVPIVEQSDCETKLRATRLGSSYVLDRKSFICAGGESSKDACTGDGGNALVCLSNGQYYAAGITVGGIQCGLPNVPGLYTNVVNYLTWINDQIKPSGGIDPRRKEPVNNIPVFP